MGGAGTGEKPDPEGLGHRRHAQTGGQCDHADRQRCRQRHDGVVSGGSVDQRLDQQPLTDKPGAQRQTTCAQCGHPEKDGGRRHSAGQPAEQVQVAQPGRGQHRSGRHEGEALKRRVRNHVQHRCGGGDRRRPVGSGIREKCCRTERQRDQAHVLGRRIGQQPFEIGGHRSLQHPIQRGRAAHGQQRKPPPAWARPQQLQIETDDAVDAQVDHRRAHQRRHRARRLRVGPRQPGVQWHQARLRTKPDQREHKYGGADPVADCPEAGEPVGTPGRRQHHQPDQDCDESQLSHHGVPQARRADLRAGVLGEHQDQRRDRHQLPRQQKRRHRARGRHQQHRRDEQRHHRHRDPTEVFTAHVADQVTTDRSRYRARERHEESAQPVELDVHAGQRKQPTDVHYTHRSKHAQQPHADPGNAHARSDDPAGRRCSGHFPVTDRSAAMMAAGVGGQPAISTSTGTTSPTAPTTP